MDMALSSWTSITQLRINPISIVFHSRNWVEEHFGFKNKIAFIKLGVDLFTDSNSINDDILKNTSTKYTGYVSV